jgi:hypothetical protein
MELGEFIVAAIESAGQSFQEGELAFLALTSKVERPLLDRIAYQLHLSLEGRQLVVAREYPISAKIRADVAVLRGNAIVAVLEAKAMYTADCTREGGLRREYSDLLDADLKRYDGITAASLQVYCLLFGTHPLAPPPPGLKRVVKYSQLLVQSFKTHHTGPAILKIVEANLGRFLRPESRFATGKLSAGVAFGIPVELWWWLYADHPDW